MTIRVVLGEDNLLTREGITGVLDRHEDIDVVAACDNLDDLRTEIDRATPDVVLTDIRMPPTNTDEGIRLATELRTRHPAVGVVVLSQHGELVYALELFARGTNRRAYLLKDRIRDRAELAQAIRAVADGGALVDTQIVDRLVGTRTQSPAAVAGLTRLTRREREILALIADGRSNGAIAGTLGITKRAVERHINGIFMKLDVGDGEDVSRRVKAALLYLARPPE